MSPLKSTMTTSMGHRYLNDQAKGDNGVLTIQSRILREGRPSHTPDDRLTVQVTMVEATDDSIIFATSLEALQRYCLMMERFQLAYGWMTQWSKTIAYAFNMDRMEGSNEETQVDMPSITLEGDDYHPEETTWHKVPLKVGELNFLRTKVDDAASRFTELKDFITNFIFPKFSCRMPITLVRKIVAQCIVSKCRALLSLQPIRQIDAVALDKLVASKVHGLMGFPYSPKTDILTLPLTHMGIDFPSIARINAGIAVDGLARDLNHHIPAYRRLARITMTDWMCGINKCQYPLEGKGLRRKFMRQEGKIPVAWITAQEIMGKIGLGLRRTDMSYITKGDVSISHCLNVCRPKLDRDVPTLQACKTLESRGVTHLKHLGDWDLWSQHGNRFRVKIRPSADVTSKKWPMNVRGNLAAISSVLEGMDASWFYDGPPNILLPRHERQEQAESIIKSLSENSPHHPSRHNHQGRYWASDGSMIPASSGILDNKSVTAALTGPRTVVAKITGRNSSILQGEVMGLIMGGILSLSGQVLYSDHLNSVRFVSDVRSQVDQTATLRNKNACSYYRWLRDIIRRSDITITYTKAHTDGISLPAVLNDDANYYASRSQDHISNIPAAPTPTFFMNDYTYYRTGDDWVESNIRDFVDKVLAKTTAELLSHGHKRRMATWIYEQRSPPPYLYQKATSAYSALLQLYARSGQLPIGTIMKDRGVKDDIRCRMGCEAIEDEHHLFIECQHFQDMRTSAGKDLQDGARRLCREKGIEEAQIDRLLTKVEFFYDDDPELWPLGNSRFYLGHVPPLAPWTNNVKCGTNSAQERFIYGLYSLFHTSSIRLAGRIFGEAQRKATKEWDEARR